MAYTTIDKPDDYFNTVLYTGNGSTQSITGVGFQPDWVWVKDRGRSGYNHIANDSVRGVTKYLRPNLTNAEATLTDAITSFDSDGFTLGSDSSNGEHNINTQTYASWNWLAGGTASSNTSGSITSSVSANTTAGFSIVSYTGTGANATIGHGLSTAPSMILVKNRSTAYSWIVYHKSLGATKNLYLDLTNASDTSSIQFNDTEPTSSVFSVGTSLATNKSGDNIIAYCFAEKKGYSKFGSYTGNGNSNGSYIHLGFKPAFFMVKRTDTTNDWQVHDNTRDTFNGVTQRLRANLSDAEVTTGVFYDFTSTGVKCRNTDFSMNASGGTYIYMAFAENPFVTSTGICCTAR